MLSEEQRHQIFARARSAISRAQETGERVAVVHERIHRDRWARGPVLKAISQRPAVAAPAADAVARGSRAPK
jgi:hypothetical protein